MIVYGTGSSHLGTKQLKNHECPNCENRDHLSVSVFSSHAHVFWIPTFPTGKKAVFECKNCGVTFKLKKMPDSVKREYKNYKGTLKTPIWKYAGLGILGLLISIGVAYSLQDNKEEEAFLANPLVADTYTYKTDNSNYTTFRITKVMPDSIYVNFNNYETNKIGGIDDIDIDENYTEEEFVIARTELKIMHDEGEIRDIERD